MGAALLKEPQKVYNVNHQLLNHDSITSYVCSNI